MTSPLPPAPTRHTLPATRLPEPAEITSGQIDARAGKKPSSGSFCAAPSAVLIWANNYEPLLLDKRQFVLPVRFQPQTQIIAFLEFWSGPDLAGKPAPPLPPLWWRQWKWHFLTLVTIAWEDTKSHAGKKEYKKTNSLCGAWHSLLFVKAKTLKMSFIDPSFAAHSKPSQRGNRLSTDIPTSLSPSVVLGPFMKSQKAGPAAESDVCCFL